MDKDQSAYLSYLLRLWRADDDGEAPGADKAEWRASLESAHTGEKRSFAALGELFEFLQDQTDGCRASEGHGAKQHRRR
jgi:hypothetical protein